MKNFLTIEKLVIIIGSKKIQQHWSDDIAIGSRNPLNCKQKHSVRVRQFDAQFLSFLVYEIHDP